MGLTFNKSINCLGGLFRLNLSAKGVGISTGVRGARISIGPNGTNISIGAHGIRFRKKLRTNKVGPTLNEEYNHIYNIWAAIGYSEKPDCGKCHCDLTGMQVHKSVENYLCPNCS